MAAEITEITPGNHEELLGYLKHVLDDLHDIRRDVGHMRATLAEYEPLIRTFKTSGLLAARRQARRGDG